MQPPSSTQYKGSSAAVASVAVVLAGIATLCTLSLRSIEAGDFYPVFYGAKLLWQGESPYSSAASTHLSSVWVPALYSNSVPVVAYPLPLLLLFSPLALCPSELANFIWLFLAVFILTGTLARERLSLAFLPFFFFPFYQAAHVQNISLLWCALAVKALTKKGGGYGQGFLLAVLLLKPQDGAIVAAYCMMRSSAPKKVTTGLLCSLATLLLVSFILQPDWVQAWLGAVDQYFHQTFMTYFLVPAVVFLLPRIPADLRSVGLQVLLFPVNGTYHVVLLLYGWCKIAMPLRALMTLSFLSLYNYPDYDLPGTLLAFTVLPLVAVTALSARSG